MAGLRFARYDRTFIRDDKFAALPPRSRLEAYGFLLAMNGWVYERDVSHPPATGILTISEAFLLGEMAGCMPSRIRHCIRVLVKTGLVHRANKSLILPKFFKWNPELAPAKIEARRIAASTAARVRWDAVGDAPAHAVANAAAHASTHAKTDQKLPKMGETEKEGRDETSSTSDVVPRNTRVRAKRADAGAREGGNSRSLSESNGLTPDLVEILVAYEAETTHAPTARDITAAHQVLELCQRLEVDRIVAEIPGAVAWVREKGGQVRTLGQLYGWMERLNRSLADAKAPLAARFQPSQRGGEMTSIGGSL